MAIVTRYFSTTGAGAADGTTWADRAALFSAGNWSTVITGFNFSGSDSLECRIGPGTYTCSQSLASGLFANAPTQANPLLLHGCDSSGNLLTPPDPDWLSCMPAWDDSTLPVINSTTNIPQFNLASLTARLLKGTASGRNGIVWTGSNAGNTYEWCVVSNSTSNTAARCLQGGNLFGCVASCTGTSYSDIIDVNTGMAVNCRATGAVGSSGNRRGIIGSINGLNTVVGCTVYGVGGDGIALTSGGTAVRGQIYRNVVANVGANGILLPSTASLSQTSHVLHNIITGCGAYGLDAQSAARAIVAHNRLRDNTSGNLNGLGNYPTDWGNYTTDSDDATEYVDAATTFDFRIKSGAAIHGGGYGVADQAAAGGGNSNPNLTRGLACGMVL